MNNWLYVLCIGTKSYTSIQIIVGTGNIIVLHTYSTNYIYFKLLYYIQVEALYFIYHCIPYMH